MRRSRRLIVLLNVLLLVLIGFIIVQKYIFENEEFLQSRFTFNSSRRLPSKLHVAVVSCGQRFQETLVMIKSALLFNHSKSLLHFLIFVEDQESSATFKEKLEDWRLSVPSEFDFSLLSVKFPLNSENEWRNLFKPCAAQRLFLPSLLENIDSLLYVDTDILFLSPVSDIWKYFSQFNETQFAALTPEHEDGNVGWYNRFARHPYYGQLGVNSGVMLMNLTRMREFKWEEHVFPIYKEYKLRITFGDQDIINILFYYHPERLFVMPCEYNFRPDHCMYMTVCNTTSGIKILHGNRGFLHNNKQPIFKEIYEAVERYQIGTNTYKNFLEPLKAALNDITVLESTCGKIIDQVLFLPNLIFINDYNYDK